ncbi:PEP-CTERM sorting domain-containing protein [Roseibacillus persicicus]|uniref:PEP-CTERM sorting domain-containing protein n=1 Tax=Roseibacillus persicicus TaxID=454148 RepID=UPI00280F2684|nr:PEP-CTERM sorting domain-containing protein [Roseibacillus persicicus]MDQ8192636.1 PEP-CTERM sorting domain-containing protein [Roseibacillus persicicus]
MKKNTNSKVLCLPTALITFGSLVSAADAAVTITISGQATAPTATVTLEGSLTLSEYDRFTGVSDRDLVVPAVLSSETLNRLGASTPNGLPTTSAFINNRANADVNRGPSTELGLFAITDTDMGDGVILSGNINSLFWGTSGFFGLRLDTFYNFSPAIDEGDVLSLSGAFDVSLGSDTFETSFIEGQHVGAYNGENVTIIVTQIPEPSSGLLVMLGASLLGCRRRQDR